VKKEIIVRTLQKQGFELVRDAEEELVEEIRRTIIELVHHLPFKSSQVIPYSEYLAKKIGKSYSSLSSIFSKHNGITIEKYAILQKIEKAKELIEYGELTFAGIAYELGYKSAQHLANQFKTVTGMSMSDYKRLPKSRRKHLDSI
jgi:AraC family transcriptional regulator